MCYVFLIVNNFSFFLNVSSVYIYKNLGVMKGGAKNNYKAMCVFCWFCVGGCWGLGSWVFVWDSLMNLSEAMSYLNFYCCRWVEFFLSLSPPPLYLPLSSILHVTRIYMVLYSWQKIIYVWVMELQSGVGKSAGVGGGVPKRVSDLCQAFIQVVSCFY